MDNYIELLNKANDQIKKVLNYIMVEHENAFDSMNLKLYDAFYYCYEIKNDFPLCYKYVNSIKDPTELFYRFCEETYNDFIEQCNEEGINFDKICHNIGRTSSFYLHKLDFNNNPEELIINLYEEINDSYDLTYLNFSNDGLIESTLIDEYKESTLDALQYFIDYFYEDTIKYCKDIITVFDLISDIKNNQVKYFKDYLENYESFLQDKENAQEQLITQYNKIVNDIKIKYQITNEDMLTLQNHIKYWKP